VYTLQATGRRDDRQLVARLNMLTIVYTYTGRSSPRRSPVCIRQSRRRSPHVYALLDIQISDLRFWILM